jgi:potassium-transporting ATPase KdpC subunit
MKVIFKSIKPAIMLFLCMTVIFGIVYTGIVTVFAQLVFPYQANGSMIKVKMRDGTIVSYGSERIAQEFSQAKYLIGRPQGVTNLSSVSEELEALVQKRMLWLKSLDPGNEQEIPQDLLTSSGSGVDPYISPAAADYQVPRIAKFRGISEQQVKAIIDHSTAAKFLGIWGEEGVNVLIVNLALDGLVDP